MPVLVRIAVLVLALVVRALTRRHMGNAPGLRDLLAGRGVPRTFVRRAGTAGRARTVEVGPIVVRVVAWLAVIAAVFAVVFLALLLYAVLGA